MQGRGRLSRFARDSRGSAALEFAMIAPWFFLLLFSMFEVGLTYTVGEVLQNAVNEAARQIRTGQVQTGGVTANQFKAMVCNNLNQMFDCSQLQVAVESFGSFGGVNYSNPIAADGTLKTAFPFVPGGPGQIVLIRGFYPWQPLTYGLGAYLLSTSDGRELLQSAAVVRNEPYLP